MIDYRDIQKQFDKVIQYSQSLSNFNTSFLFEDWEKNKEWFYYRFGESLIYEVPETVSFTLTEQQKSKKVEDFIYNIERKWKLFALSEFIYKNRVSFFNNTVTCEYQLPDGGPQIPLGMKITKAFKFFIPDDKELLNEIQTMASMILQEDKISGKLCFSIHPLDYLSSSETTYMWRSCHALDGDYRAGNLSYMADSSTIVCYLKSVEEKQLPNFPSTVPWNSKKWRMLIHFSDNKDAIFAGRQYPFVTINALEEVWKHLIPLISQGFGNRWSKWHNEYLSTSFIDDPNVSTELYYDYLYMNGKLYPKNNLFITDSPNPLHYNDILFSTIYKNPYYCWRTGLDSSSKIHFTIGSKVKCLCCGEDFITNSDVMYCAYCEEEQDDYQYCECCDRRIYDDNYYMTYNGSCLCQSCFEENCGQCDHCGELFWNEELAYVADHNEKHLYCSHCYNQLFPTIEKDNKILEENIQQRIIDWVYNIINNTEEENNGS